MSKRKTRVSYSSEEDKVIKRLGDKGWSLHEVSYQIFKELNIKRNVMGLSQRRVRLIADGFLEAQGPGKRFVTSEALGWYNKTFGSNFGPSGNLELTEHRSKKGQTREVVGFSSRPGYTIQLLRLQKKQPETIDLFQSLLQAAIDEERTALDVVEDLREASA